MQPISEPVKPLRDAEIDITESMYEFAVAVVLTDLLQLDGALGHWCVTLEEISVVKSSTVSHLSSFRRENRPGTSTQWLVFGAGLKVSPRMTAPTN
jgi:hypothetical protein